MTNQPDFIQPRVRRRAANGGSAPITLAEQSTRVLIRLPRVATSAIAPPRQPIADRPASEIPAAAPISNASISPTINKPAAIIPITSAPGYTAAPNYTTAVPSTGSVLGDLMAAKPQVARVDSTVSISTPVSIPTPPSTHERQAVRIDAAHTATTAPHVAPDWLDDRSSGFTKFMRQQLPLLLALMAGIAMGIVVMHSRGHSNSLQPKDASRIHSATQESPEHPQAAANFSDTQAAEANESAKLSRTAGATAANKTNGSMWRWNPPGAANAPATIGQPNGSPSLDAAANVPANVGPNGAHGNDSAPTAWLQGTITSPPAPIQR